MKENIRVNRYGSLLASVGNVSHVLWRRPSDTLWLGDSTVPADWAGSRHL